MDSTVQKFVGGVIFVVLSLVLLFVVIPLEIQVSDASIVGPRMWPSLNAVFLGICGMALVVSSLKNISFSQLMTNTKGTGKGKRPIKQLVFALIAVTYIGSIEFLGFIISTIIGIQVTLPYFGSKRYFLNLVLSIIVTLVIFFIFTQVLKIRLPLGFLF